MHSCLPEKDKTNTKSGTVRNGAAFVCTSAYKHRFKQNKSGLLFSQKFLRVFRGLFSKRPLNGVWGSAPHRHRHSSAAGLFLMAPLLLVPYPTAEPPAPHSPRVGRRPARGLAPPSGGVRPRAARPEGSHAARAAGVPPAGGFYSLCRGCTSYSHYSILRTAHRPLSYSAIKQWPVGCGFILSLWPAFVNP